MCHIRSILQHKRLGAGLPAARGTPSPWICVEVDALLGPSTLLVVMELRGYLHITPPCLLQTASLCVFGCVSMQSKHSLSKPSLSKPSLEQTADITAVLKLGVVQGSALLEGLLRCATLPAAADDLPVRVDCHYCGSTTLCASPLCKSFVH